MTLTPIFDTLFVQAREETLDALIGTHQGHCTVIDTKLDDEGRIVTVLECGCGYIFEARAVPPALRCPPCKKARALRRQA